MRYLILTTFIIVTFCSNAYAKNYFVKNDGNDNADGTTDATAWKTISKVNSFTFKSSDDVYFKVGDTWNLQQLVIDWSGSSIDRATVGAYYLNNGVETIGVPSGLSKPVITGGYISTQSIGKVPLTLYSGLVAISGNYVTIQNLHVKDSSGDGISITGKFSYGIIENNEITHTTGSLVRIYAGSNNAIVRNNSGSKCVWSDHDGIKPYASHPGCIALSGSSYSVVENNIIHDLYGEGVNIVNNSNYNIVKGNSIFNGRYVGIYLDNAHDNVIEQNIIIGKVSNTKSHSGIGASIEPETPQINTINNVIKNNLIAGVDTCFYIGIFPEPRALGNYTNGKFIGNTCVAADNAIMISQDAIYQKNWELANNIFWDISRGDLGCTALFDADISFHNNSWPVTPRVSTCQGTNDVIGDPKLNSSSDFRLYSFSNQPTVKSFEPQGVSPVIGKGASITDLTTDFNKQTRPSKPTIGALETGSAVSTVSPPTGLTITIK